MTCASGTLVTTSAMSFGMSVYFGRIALARVEFRRDGEVTGLGDAPADVLDVLVHAEDFLHDQHDREIAARRRHRAVGRHLAVLGRHLDLAGDQAFGGGGDGLRRHRQHGQREARAERGDDEAAPVDVARAEQALQFGSMMSFKSILQNDDRTPWRVSDRDRNPDVWEMRFSLRGRPVRPRASSVPCPGLRVPGTACSFPGSSDALARPANAAAGRTRRYPPRRPPRVVRHRAGRSFAGSLVILASAAGSGTPSSAAHLSVSGSSSSSPMAPGSASAKGTSLASSSTGAWSEQIESMVPSATPARSAARSRVRAQRRHEIARWHRTSRCRRRTGAGGGRRRRRSPACPPAWPRGSARRFRPRTGGATCTRTPVSRASARIVASAIVSASAGMPARPRRVATSPSCATPPRPRCGSAARSHRRWPKVAAYCIARQSSCGVDQRHVGLREGDAARLGELAHLGQRGALQLRPTAHRPDTRAPG